VAYCEGLFFNNKKIFYLKFFFFINININIFYNYNLHKFRYFFGNVAQTTFYKKIIILFKSIFFYIFKLI